MHDSQAIFELILIEFFQNYCWENLLKISNVKCTNVIKFSYFLTVFCYFIIFFHSFFLPSFSFFFFLSPSFSPFFLLFFVSGVACGGGWGAPPMRMPLLHFSIILNEKRKTLYTSFLISVASAIISIHPLKVDFIYKII